MISAISFDVAVLEMRQDERGAGDVTDLAGARGDGLHGAPAAGDQGERAFAEAAQRAEQGVAGTGTDIGVLPAGRQPDRGVDADADAVATTVTFGSRRTASSGSTQGIW